jgi:hypothetical protein
VNTYVYGIADRSHPALPDGARGVGDPARAVRTIVEDGLAAVVSDAPEGLRPARRELMAHQKVLHQAEAEGPVLPMRFGSVAPDDASVRSVLVQRGAHFRERLRALAGKSEYHVRAAHDEAAVLRRVLARHPEIKALSDANNASGGGSHRRRLQLGELVVAAVRDMEAEDARDLYGALEPVTVGMQGGSESTAWLVDVSFLVEHASTDAFRAAVARMRAARPHLRLQINGPLPPYSFVEPGPAQSAAPGGPLAPRVQGVPTAAAHGEEPRGAGDSAPAAGHRTHTAGHGRTGRD